MKGIWPKYKTPFLFGSIGALFHLCTVVLVLIITGGSGERQGWIVLLLDFPLVVLLQVIPHGNIFLYGSVLNYIFFFSLFGTAMYSGVVWLVGYFWDYLGKVFR